MSFWTSGAARSPLPDYADPCGWNLLLPPRAPREPARGSIRAKYAVVGAGYTGLAAARRRAPIEPGAAVVVLEGTTIGEGSSARNSGFVTRFDVKSGLSTSDAERADRINVFAEEGFDYLLAATTLGGFSCDLERSGRILAAATPAGEKKVQAMLDGAKAHGVACERLEGDALEAVIGSRYYRSAARTDVGYLLQPAALVRGLADTLPQGVRLFENSPVLSLEGGPVWTLGTPDATITADHVILATNAAIKNFGYWRDGLVAIYTYASLTQEMDERDLATLGVPVWGVLPAHRLGSTLRRVGRNRLMIRSLYAYEKPIESAEAKAALTDRLHRRFPQLSHVTLEHVWGGTTALTMNGSPRWGGLAPGLWGSAGCNGSGVVKGTVLGKRLAEAIVTCDPQEALQAAYGSADRIAPEPFRRLGFRAISAWESRRAGLEI